MNNMTNEERVMGGIASSGILKVDHYHWDELDKQCVHMRIAINDLRVDEYQRGEARRSAIIEKSKHMIHAALGACVVGKRADGSFWLVDGLQRKLAAQRRGDVTHLDCMVFESSGAREEAKVFMLCNKGRVAVSSYDKFKAAIYCGDEPHVSIAAWLKERNYSISKQSGNYCVCFPTQLVQIWNIDDNIAKDALDICFKIGEGYTNSDIFKGVATLMRKGVQVAKELEKLKTSGGVVRIMQEINSCAILQGKSKSWNICSLGILNIINHKRKNKIQCDLT